MNLKAPKGTQDLFGAEVYAWQQAEVVIRKLCSDFGIEEVRTPTFEHTELYQRGVGETTDIVQKELFRFTDRGGREYSLRPEITAGVARAFIQHGMYQTPQPTKLFYISSAFRAERPQKGRMIEFHQFGIELIGSYNPATDAEAISVAYELLRRFDIKNTTLKINSIGCTECRNKYNQALVLFISKNKDNLCSMCRDRADRNPLRVLDCKNAQCQDVLKNAPIVLDYLDDECTEHFEAVKENLTNLGIPFEVDTKLVRGLDYYTRTVFEIIASDLGAQSTVCGGGRYDNLIQECGGPEMGSCGFGVGLERLMIILEAQGNLPAYKRSADIFIGSIGPAGFKKAQTLVFDLRKKGISAEGDTLGRSVKAQLKYADKIGAKYSFVIGDDEIKNNRANIKFMATGEQTEVNFCDIYNFVSHMNSI